MIAPAAAAARSGFWAMGGFAFYVWGAYGAGLLVLLWNILSPGLRRVRLLRELAEDAPETARGEER